MSMTKTVAEAVAGALGNRSVKWLAEAAAIPRPTLQRRLRTGDFSMSELIRVSEALNVDLGVLIPFTGPSAETIASKPEPKSAA